MIKYKIQRIWYHVKKYGILRTIQKVITKIFKPNQQNDQLQKKAYQNWIAQNEPQEKDLSLQKKQEFKIQPKISIVVPMYNTD